MLSAEVVNSPDQMHSCFKRVAVPGYGSPSAYKSRQALAKRGIESFNERCVDNSSPLRMLKHSFNLSRRAFNDSPLYADHSPLLVLLYGLRNEDFLPHFEARATGLATDHSLTKHEPNGTDVSLQSIRAKQQSQAQGASTGAHLLNQRAYKSRITALADNPSQPKSCAYHQGQSHPTDAALLFYTKLIHLHLAQVTRCGDELVMNGLAMESGAVSPVRNSALIKTKGSNYCLSRAAKRTQSDHLCDKLLRMAKPIESSARRFSKCLLTYTALVAALFQRVDRDVAFKEFASGRTVHITDRCIERLTSHRANPAPAKKDWTR